MEREERRRRRRRRDLLRGTIAAGITLLLIAAIVLGVSTVRDVRGDGKDTSCIVEIPDGVGTSGVARILKEDGVIRFPSLFRLYVRKGDAPTWQRGRHTVNGSMGYRELITRLEAMPDVDENGVKRVVIPEGYELRQIVDLLVEQGLGEREAFLREMEQGSFAYDFISQIPERENRLEGYLYPDTYLFSMEESEHDIIDKMLAAFAQKVVPAYQAASTSYTLDQIVNLAAVIEREAANDAERPKVSSVFYNRMERGMKLESCATVQYILKERKKVLSLDDIAIDSPYNTYLYRGLPAGPIASPGLASVEAALKPEKTNYLYFVARADGSENLFSETFEEHNQKTRETQGS